jgi:hypothetical protein
MRKLSPLKIAAAGVVGVCGLAALALGARPVTGQSLSGFDVYRSNCDGCHELYDPESPKRTRAQWDDILVRMVKQRGATLTPAQHAAVLNYLDSFNRPKREIKWIEVPAKSRKATFAAADSGKLPAEWVDLVIGSDSQVPWTVQADAATKAIYLSPLKGVGENQFPVLIDNSGLVDGGSVLTRLQIVSGKGNLGAGVVFGFRNPQSYFGVRISPRDVVLYEVQGGQRALLARAPMALAQKKWHTLGVDLAGKEAKVSVNGQPVAALTRTLAGYQAGRVGVHTQGDTLALFDQWQVTVR